MRPQIPGADREKPWLAVLSHHEVWVKPSDLRSAAGILGHLISLRNDQLSNCQSPFDSEVDLFVNCKIITIHCFFP